MKFTNIVLTLVFCFLSNANANTGQPKLGQLNANTYTSKAQYIRKSYSDSQKGVELLQSLHDDLCERSKSNDPEAQYALAWIYENGVGVENHPTQAEQLYRLSASNNYQQAIALLERYRFSLVEQVDKDKLPSCLKPKKIIPVDVDPKVIIEEPSPIVQNMAERHKKIYNIVEEVSYGYGLDPYLVLCFISTESNFNQNAVSPKKAQGLMQLIPETASRFGVKNPFNAKDNINGGVAYLEWLLSYYQGNIELVAAAYNAGEGAVDKYKGIPPYKETRAYVKKIIGLYNKKTHSYRDDLIEPSSLCNAAC